MKIVNKIATQFKQLQRRNNKKNQVSDHIDNIITLFTNLTIKARFSFAYNCINENKILSNSNIHFNKFWVKFGEYSYRNDLDIWLEEVKEYTPYIILDNHPNALSRLTKLSLSQAESLKELYLSWPNYYCELIDNLFFLSTCELFGSPKKYSPETLLHIYNILHILDKNKMKICDFQPYLKYQVSEYGIWGWEQ